MLPSLAFLSLLLFSLPVSSAPSLPLRRGPRSPRVPPPRHGPGPHNDVGDPENDTTPLPLVIWHGLGDTFSNPGLQSVAQLATEVNPGTYVHIIKLGDGSPDSDREASFFGNVTSQIEDVCAQLKHDRILSTAPAINALGLSQGGQFLRAYVERCNAPPVHNLLTLGSQHSGIAAFQHCGTFDFLCRAAMALLRYGRWSNFAQSRLVPAQYYRGDPRLGRKEHEAYLEHSAFLADVNNERELKKERYRRNMLRLNHFAMMVFEDDTLVVPKESGFFADLNVTDGNGGEAIVPLRERKLYKEDWLGLKRLDRLGKLSFDMLPGDHMQLQDETLRELFKKWFAPVDLGTIGKIRQETAEMEEWLREQEEEYEEVPLLRLQN